MNAVVLADDSGLEIDYLNKEPGIYSARYMGEDTSYDIKNQTLLDRLEGVPDEKRTARFVCAIAAAMPDGSCEVVRGTMEGRIGHEIAGENGFGYDPIFFLPEYGCTSAELSPEKKNELSHRGEKKKGCGSAWLERLVWDQEVAGSNPVTPIRSCGCSSMVEHQPSKLDTWVRFPSPAFPETIVWVWSEI